MEYKYDKLNVSIEEHVGKIIINDPPGNCFTLKVMKAILDILDRFEADDDVRCVMFSHEGPNFSSHGSGHEEDEYILENGYSLQEVFRIFREPGEKLVKRIDEYPQTYHLRRLRRVHRRCPRHISILRHPYRRGIYPFLGSQSILGHTKRLGA